MNPTFKVSVFPVYADQSAGEICAFEESTDLGAAMMQAGVYAERWLEAEADEPGDEREPVMFGVIVEVVKPAIPESESSPEPAAPVVVNEKRLTCAETAKLVRRDLKAAFPGVKFSVRSSTYAGGASIHVRWIDGPVVADVDEVVGKYAGATFNGMIDMKEYHPSTLIANEDGTFEDVRYGADFVQTHRDYSPEREAQIKAEVREFLGRDFDPAERVPLATARDGVLAWDRHGPGSWASDVLHQLLYARPA